MLIFATTACFICIYYFRYLALSSGPPDEPSSLTAEFVASYVIVVGFNCMWSNGSPQQIFLQLKSLSNNNEVDILYPIVYDDCYNSSNYAYFKNGIQPETDYEVSVWSTNDLGSSNTVKLTVKTPKIFKLEFSPKTITFNGNQAIINFTASEGQISSLSIQCCLEVTGTCDYTAYAKVDDTDRQVTCANLPTGDLYVFSLTAFGRNRQGSYYYLGIARVTLSRTEVIEPEGEFQATNNEEN